ncbi:hypothetical protein MUP59_08220 [Candidatus Bathyarchaeota archaeon]|nr:hypothetical protein [Candidatus Bathyarchaeota archaeon]
MSCLSDIILLITNRKKVFAWLKQSVKQDEKDYAIVLSLQDYGIRALAGNPMCNIGAALRLADEYHIQLHVGTCFRDCRAVLERENWKRDISPTANVWDYSLFCKQSPDKVDFIQEIDISPCRAICGCLLRAKKSGVI